MTYDLRTLQAIADLACAEAFKNRHQFERDAINWGDLGCVWAERYETHYGATGHRVWIEEASPDAAHLQAFIRDELSKRGFTGVEVMTEW